MSVDYWSPYQDRRLLALASEDAPIDLMQEALPGRTPQAIKYRLHVLRCRQAVAQGKGPPTNRDKAWTDEESEKLAKLRKSGLPFKEIANAMGRTKNSVVGRYYRMSGGKQH